MLASLNAASLSLGAIPLPTVSLPAISLPTIALPTISLPTTTLLTRLVTPIIKFGDYVLGLLRAAFSCPSVPLFCDFDTEDPEMGISLCVRHANTHSSVLAMEGYDKLEDEMEERMRIRCGAYTVKIDEKGWLRMG